ncbi:ComGF family competence protein [Aneurinibacillus terranovensis]|uniref:ComGF family competence protein n=1 Tax=Aneurinibacillus terranovensis TaxID=278991 RepID=UPI00041916B0|nr:ComGF family competence protein [Aneurinibacillus terranovensis]
MTLIEVLVSSMVVMMITVCLLAFYMQSSRHIQNVKDTSILDAEARAFFAYIEGEMHGGHGFLPLSDRLQFYDKYNNLIFYEVRDKKIRRRVNFTGYVVLLTYVRSAAFESAGNGCWFHLVLERNHVYWRGSFFIAGRVIR